MKVMREGDNLYLYLDTLNFSIPKCRKECKAALVQS